MDQNLQVIGAIELLEFPENGHTAIMARVDTGASTSAIWASEIAEANGMISFRLFDAISPHYNGEVVTAEIYKTKIIKSSNGERQRRYVVQLLVTLGGRRIRAWFTLANRSSQTYSVLIGRNVLSGKFLVDVRHGHQLKKKGKS